MNVRDPVSHKVADFRRWSFTEFLERKRDRENESERSRIRTGTRADIDDSFGSFQRAEFLPDC